MCEWPICQAFYIVAVYCADSFVVKCILNGNFGKLYYIPFFLLFLFFFYAKEYKIQSDILTLP